MTVCMALATCSSDRERTITEAAHEHILLNSVQTSYSSSHRFKVIFHKDFTTSTKPGYFVELGLVRSAMISPSPGRPENVSYAGTADTYQGLSGAPQNWRQNAISIHMMIGTFPSVRNVNGGESSAKDAMPPVPRCTTYEHQVFLRSWRLCSSR